MTSANLSEDVLNQEPGMENNSNQIIANLANVGQVSNNQNGVMQILMSPVTQSGPQNVTVSLPLQSVPSSSMTITASQILQMSALASQQQQHQQIGVGDNNVNHQGLGQSAKRPLTNVVTSGQGEHVTNKVIITKNPNTNQPMASAVMQGISTTTTKITPTLIQTADGRTLLTDGNGRLLTTSGSPIKLVTVSQGTSGQKNLIVTSTKKSPILASGSKLPIAPIKSPTKILTKSPKKINEMFKASSSGTGSQNALTSGLVRLVHVVTSSNASTLSCPTMGTNVPIQVQAMTAGTNVSAMGNIAALQGAQKPQYMRIVSMTTGSTTVSTAKPVTAIQSVGKPIAPAPATQVTASSGTNLQGSLKVSQILPKTTTTQPRFIMPANAQLKIINSVAGQSGRLTQLPPGTTLLATQAGGIIQGITMVPSNYVTQPVNPAPLQEKHTIQLHIKQEPVSQNDMSPLNKTNSHSKTNGVITDGSGRPRKPCNCTKSQCLKLYCDCFANGEFCRDCNCNNCLNNLDHEEERQKAIKSCLDRNPQAFHPKIGKSKGGDASRRHNKGCNCKRSGCLKNYCECYEAKIPCSSICKCVGCKNFEESPERKTLMHLADAAEVRHQQQAAAQDKLSSQIQEFPTRPAEFGESGERLPFSFMTSEVAEATCNCMLAQAEEGEKMGHSIATTEMMILEEFGRCLKHVIQSAGRSKGPS